MLGRPSEGLFGDAWKDGAFQTSFNNPFRWLWALQASSNNPSEGMGPSIHLSITPFLSLSGLPKVWGLPSEAITHGSPFRVEGSFGRKALCPKYCKMLPKRIIWSIWVALGPKWVKNHAKTGLAAIFQQPLRRFGPLFQQPLRRVWGLPRIFKQPLPRVPKWCQN